MSGNRGCQRCGHRVAEHGRRGGRCGGITYTEHEAWFEDGAELHVHKDLAYCDCPYLLASG